MEVGVNGHNPHCNASDVLTPNIMVIIEQLQVFLKKFNLLVLLSSWEAQLINFPVPSGIQTLLATLCSFYIAK